MFVNVCILYNTPIVSQNKMYDANALGLTFQKVRIQYLQFLSKIT